ncbi:hypothetical protein SK128_018483, partial [Halocaridina rubra]
MQSNSSSPLVFTEALEDVSKILQEGMRGIMVSMVEETMPSTDSASTQNGPFQIKKWIKLAAIEAPGDGSWNLALAATWSSGRMNTLQNLWPLPSFNLRRRTIRITCLQKPKVFQYNSEGGLDEASGYIIDLMLLLRERLNFTDVLVPTEGFGLLQPNGSYNGMVGVIQRKEADMGALDFTPSHARTKILEF